MRAVLPCRKCITFAICKTKKKLECPLLYDYYFTSTNGGDVIISTKWKRIRAIEGLFENRCWEIIIVKGNGIPRLIIEWEKKYHQPAHAMGIK